MVRLCNKTNPTVKTLFLCGGVLPQTLEAENERKMESTSLEAVLAHVAREEEDFNASVLASERGGNTVVTGSQVRS